MRIPAAPTRGRRIAGAPSAAPDIPRDRAAVGKRLAIAPPAAKEGVPVDEVSSGAKTYKLGRGGVYRATRDLTRAKRAGTIAAAAAAAGAGVHLAGRRQLQAHPDRRPTAGRMAAGTILGPYHAAAAGKPGQKLKAIAPYAPVAVAGGIVNHKLMGPHLAPMQAAMTRATEHSLDGDSLRAAHALREGIGHMGAGYRATLPVTAASLAAGAAITRYNASRGRYKEQPMSKRQDASPGRYAAGMLFGGAHGVVAGKPGRKLGAGAVETVPTLLAAPLALAGVKTGRAALNVAAGAVKYGGRAAAVNANQQAGNLKRQPVGKSMTCLPTDTRVVVARTPGGRYASHANDLVHLQVVTRHAPSTHTVNAGAARALPQHASASRMPERGRAKTGRRLG